MIYNRPKKLLQVARIFLHTIRSVHFCAQSCVIVGCTCDAFALLSSCGTTEKKTAVNNPVNWSQMTYQTQNQWKLIAFGAGFLFQFLHSTAGMQPNLRAIFLTANSIVGVDENVIYCHHIVVRFKWSFWLLLVVVAKTLIQKKSVKLNHERKNQFLKTLKHWNQRLFFPTFIFLTIIIPNE